MGMSMGESGTAENWTNFYYHAKFNAFTPDFLEDSSVFEFGHIHFCKLGAAKKTKPKKKKNK